MPVTDQLKASKEVQEAKAQSAEAERQLQKAREQFSDQVRNLARRANEQANDFNAQYAELERVLASREIALKDSLRRIEEADGLRADAAAKLEKLAADFAALQKELASQKQAHAADLRAHQTILAETSAAIEAMQRGLASEKEMRATVQAAFTRAQEEIVRLHREKDDASREAKGLRTELNRIRSSRRWKFVDALSSAAHRAEEILRRLGIEERQTRQARLLATSELFDRAWYLAQYTDVAENGIDPALHYIRYGAAEGRDPGPNFNSRQYLKKYKDVAKAGINPLIHYLSNGAMEGREIAPSSSSPAMPPVVMEPAVLGVEPFSSPSEAAPLPWLKQVEIVRRDGYTSTELSGVILGIEPTLSDARNESASSSALLAFCRLMGIDAREKLRCYRGDTPLDLPDPAGAALDVSLCLVFSLGPSQGKVVVADIWYVNDRDLRVRFGSDPEPHVARFFQFDVLSGSLEMVGESVLTGRQVEFADLTLVNAFLPVLITLSTPTGELLATSLLPFPSLCRGGSHYGEVRAAHPQESDIDGLRAASQALLEEFLGTATAPKFAVARVEVDLQGALGSERIFSREIQEWLATVMHVKVTAAGRSAIGSPKASVFLEEGLRAPSATVVKAVKDRIASREDSGAVALILPADGIPAIQSLVAHSLSCAPGPARTAGSFIIADISVGTPRWSVKLPPFGEDLLALQPAATAIGFPMMTGLSPRANNVDSERRPAPLLAVRFPEKRATAPQSLIMPVAPDNPEPLLRRSTRGANQKAATVSVVVASAHEETFAAFLESLRLQTIRVAQIVVACGAAEVGRNTMENALRRTFPDRYVFLEGAGDLLVNARIDLAAELATGDLLVICGAAIVLHDPRTLETLCALADHDKVASAGCTLLQSGAPANNTVVAFRSAGMFTMRGANSAETEIVLSEPNHLGVLPVATYPVAGNSVALFAVRTDVWRALGGYEATKSPDVHGDVEYCIRAITKGLFHFCTSVVSVELCDPGFRPVYAGALLPPLGLDIRESIGLSAVVIEALQ